MKENLPSFIAESVVTILPHTMEMCLMFSVVTVHKGTILIEPRCNTSKSI